MDALELFLREHGVKIVDAAAEYYDDYYAVFSLDPDGFETRGYEIRRSATSELLSEEAR